MNSATNQSSESKQKKRAPEARYIAGDFIMLILLVLNLLFLSFDWLFLSQWFKDLVEGISPAFFEFYATQVHPNFVAYDLIFIGIFLTEFFVRWMISIRNNEFEYWYYFPFVYWYDLIGCIPIGGFRFFRLLRIITILVRLQHMGLIDLTKSGPYRFVMYYFNVFVEEITDQVTLKILGNVRAELDQGTPVIDRIVADVLLPRQAELTDWLSMRLRLAASKGYAMHEEDMRSYVQERINEAVEKNQELRNLENIPVMGRMVVKQIEGAISDIVYNVMTGIIRDLGSSKNREFIDDLSHLLLEHDTHEQDPETGLSEQDLNVQVADVISESLGIVIERVNQNRWTPRNGK